MANPTSGINGVLKIWFSQPIIDSWPFVSVLVYPSISVPTLPPPFSLTLPPQYSLYPITASLLVWSSFGCRHNENWQDTLLSTALHQPSLVRPPYLPPFLHPCFQQWIHFFIMLFLGFFWFFFTPPFGVPLTLSCSNFFLPWLVFTLFLRRSMHLSPADWLILTV